MHTYANELTIKAFLPRDRRRVEVREPCARWGDSGNFCSMYLKFFQFQVNDDALKKKVID